MCCNGPFSAFKQAAMTKEAGATQESDKLVGAGNHCRRDAMVCLASMRTSLTWRTARSVIRCSKPIDAMPRNVRSAPTGNNVAMAVSPRR